jgi:putative ABC transport system ATP-binding protein
MIELKNISKTYGKKETAFTALSEVSFSIPDGASVAIVGKSGSGKSTLMHVMSGLDPATEGQVIVDGVNIAGMKAKAKDSFRSKKMGFVFQSFFVEANQKVLSNVSLPLEISNVRPRARKARALQALTQVELADKADSRARNLSGGQKQRLAIARAIVNKPSIIFADEPTGNLDSETGDKIMQLLFSMNKKLGATLVMVTHDHDLASMCDIKVYIKDGRLENITGAAKAGGKK